MHLNKKVFKQIGNQANIKTNKNTTPFINGVTKTLQIRNISSQNTVR